MKTLFAPFNIILIIVVLGITGCASQVIQLPPTLTPVPEATTESLSATVLEMVERMNAGDLEGSLAYFADDAMGYIVGLPPTGMEVYAGKEQIRTLWQDSIDNHFQWEVEITNIDGNVVYVGAKTWHDFTRQLEVAPLEWIDAYEVQDGKIVTYATTITEESLAKLKPALAEVIPPEPSDTPSSDPPVSEMAVTIAGGTCTTDNTMALQAGKLTVTLNVKDQENDGYALTFFNLDEGKDIMDLMASTTMASPPYWSNMFSFVELGPGESKTYSPTVGKGPVYLICWSKPPDLPIGNAGPFEVKQ
jgi:hypothetical protein